MIDIAVVVFGLVIGSFLNVCIYRIPRGESIVYPPSACPVCKNRIKWYDNIPVLSFVLLKGRCRYCKSPISVVYPAVEMLTAIFTYLVYRKFGICLDLAVYLIFGYALIVASFIDLKHFIIPDRISIGLIVVGLIFALLQHRVVDSLIGGAAGFLILYAVAVFGKLIFKKEAMGGGDIKLLSGIGTFIGLKGVLFSLFVGSFVGAAAGIGYMLISKKDSDSQIPFGPALSFAAVLYIFVGSYFVRYFWGF
ncbi:prepilin peptidase [Hippea jasoniae]|uniref:prepilin peptidase n=1 Tax=Hippea jasoniae TaxID=944479 RepID=UPI0005552067|nr:A24 family peptidase [Hippea jasoniae]